jgi:hypothetical protein
VSETIKLEADQKLTSERRSASLLKTKISEPVLLVHAVKSLDDAIDFINSDSSELLAAYHFGENAQCKYLSQFVPSQVSYVNHIPAELLGQYSTLELTKNARPRLTPNLSRSRLPNRPPHYLNTLPNRPLHTPNPRLRHQHHTIKDRRSSPERSFQIRKVDCSTNTVPSSCFRSAFSTQATKANTCELWFLRAVYAVESWLCAVVDWCYHCGDCDSWKAREGLLLPLIVVLLCCSSVWCLDAVSFVKLSVESRDSYSQSFCKRDGEPSSFFCALACHQCVLLINHLFKINIQTQFIRMCEQ